MYTSTRGSSLVLNASQAIIRGLADDGGLFVPQVMPRFNVDDIKNLSQLTYRQRACIILASFLNDYSPDEIRQCVDNAYMPEKFDNELVAPLCEIDESLSVLELWHGPTSAFKDMALQLLPQLLSTALRKEAVSNEIVILVATSGDTGKAALEGFKDVNKTRIIVFYPSEGVSEIQKLQMVTQEGKNTFVVAVNGNFDDAQTGVKNIFNDVLLREIIEHNGFSFSSANSINWGRLVPQIVYYFSAYADMLKSNRISANDKINFVVPTGNFGNILAGYYALCMGLPINKLICASNANDVLTEFLMTGVYNRKRIFHKTLSPSMDILVSSNLERLLYHLSGNTNTVKNLMEQLEKNGCYSVNDDIIKAIHKIFWAGFADDDKTIETIKYIYDKFNYVVDPHTAVAWHVYEDYKKQSGDDTPTVIVSTASPFKFADSVNFALSGNRENLTGFEQLEKLTGITKWNIPAPLASLREKPILHAITCEKSMMKDTVLEILSLSERFSE